MLRTNTNLNLEIVQPVNKQHVKPSSLESSQTDKPSLAETQHQNPALSSLSSSSAPPSFFDWGC